MIKKFELGEITATRAVADRMNEDPSCNFARFIDLSLNRYKKCDWGDTCEEDARLNDYAVDHGERILAVYIYDEDEAINYNYYLISKMLDRLKKYKVFVPKKTSEKNPEGERIWIITEWDRSATTILFPSEY